MKLFITQIVLGVIIIVVGCITARWFIQQVPEHRFEESVNTSYSVVSGGGISFFQPDDTPFNVGKYIPIVLPILGALLLTVYAIQYSITVVLYRRFTKVNIIISLMILVTVIVVLAWVYPIFKDSYYGVDIFWTGVDFTIIYPPPQITIFLVSILVLSVAAIGISIEQLVQLKKQNPVLNEE